MNAVLSTIGKAMDTQQTVFDDLKISLNDDDTEIDVDNCFVATEEEITEWVEGQEGSAAAKALEGFVYL